MTVRLTYTSYGRQARSSGIEVDDDGLATGWQTAGNRVGRFARELSGSERSALQRALTAARNAAAHPVTAGGPIPPSGATDRLVADDLPDLVLSNTEPAPPGYDELYQLLLVLREDVTESPIAAIELEVSGSPLAARLRHIGSEPVTTRMATLTVDATLFDRDSAIVGGSTHTVDASSASGPAGPDWEFPLVKNLGVATPSKGGFLTVTVGKPEVDSLGDGVLRETEFSWMAE